MPEPLSPAEEIARWFERRAARFEEKLLPGEVSLDHPAYRTAVAAEHRRLAALARQIERDAFRRAVAVARKHAREIADLGRGSGWTTAQKSAAKGEAEVIATELTRMASTGEPT